MPSLIMRGAAAIVALSKVFSLGLHKVASSSRASESSRHRFALGLVLRLAILLFLCAAMSLSLPTKSHSQEPNTMFPASSPAPPPPEVGVAGVGPGHILNEAFHRTLFVLPNLSALVTEEPIALPNYALAEHVGAGPAIQVYQADVGNRWTWKYYYPGSSTVNLSCYMELVGPGVGDPNFASLVTNCGNFVVEVLGYTSCPCTSSKLHSMQAALSGFTAASQVGLWDVVIDFRETPNGTDSQVLSTQFYLEAHSNLGGSTDNPYSSSTDDPVNVANGNFVHQHTDVVLPGRGPALEFTRSYNSMNAESGPLGYGWTHNYNLRLIVDSTDSYKTKVVRVSEQGGRATFLRGTNPPLGTISSYWDPPGTHENLVKNADESFTLTRKDQTKYNFDPTGKLQSIVDRNGNRVSLQYDETGLDKACDGTCDDSGGDTDPRLLDFTNEGGRITQVYDPQATRSVLYTYDVNGDLDAVTDVEDKTTNFNYSGHKMTVITDANVNQITQNFYDASGRVERQKDGELNQTCIYYGAPPANNPKNGCPTVSPAPGTNQTIVVNRRGYKTTYTLNAVGATTEVKDAQSPAGLVTYTYESPGNPATQCSSTGLHRKLCSVTDQGDGMGNRHKIEFQYDSRGNVLVFKNALGQVWNYSYTFSDDLQSETEPARPSESDPQQLVRRCSRYEYGADGKNLTKITRYRLPAGSPSLVCGGGIAVGETTFGRSPSGNGDLVSVTDGNTPPHTTSFSYDPLYGLPDTVMDANGHTTNYDFDPAGRLGCVIDAEGHQTWYEYDKRNAIRKVHDPENTAFTAGACVVAGQDKYTEYQYDNKGKLKLAITWGAASTLRTMEYAYDKNDRLTKVIEPLRTAVQTAESGAQCGTLGTGNGVNDDSSQDTVVDDGCPSWIYGYDGNGNLTSRKDSRLRPPMSNGYEVTYGYDSVDRLTSIAYPDVSLNVAYTYYPDGLRKTMDDSTSSPSTLTEHEYFADHRLKKITHPDDTFVQYEYDNVGNRTRVIYPDASKDVDYTYDDFNRMKTVTDWLNNITTYTYDGAGNLDLAAINNAGPDDLVFDHSYDAADRLVSLTNRRGATTLSSYAYVLDDVGNRERVTAGATTTAYEYDNLYRLKKECLNTTACPGSDPASQNFTYDPAGNRLTKVTNGQTTTYLFDGADQLNRVCTATPCPSSPPDINTDTHYGYGGNGALTYFGPNADPNNVTADVAKPQNLANVFLLQDYDGRYLRTGHCLLQLDAEGEDNNAQMRVDDILRVVDEFFIDVADPAGYEVRTDVSPVGGPNGQMRVDDILNVASQFFHDQQNGATGCADTAHFFYNGDGLRVRKWVGGAKTDYYWDVGAGLPTILQETTTTSAQAAQTTYYVYGLDLISSVQGSASTYFLYDGLGSTTGLTDSNGMVQRTYDYDAFGVQRPPVDSADTNVFRFTGEQQDSSGPHGPYYLRARYYDPTLGRFWTPDPFRGFPAAPQSLNRYSYASNRPVDLVDPWGLCGLSSWSDFGDCFEPITEPVANGLGALADCVTDIDCSQDVSLAMNQSATFLSVWRAAIADAFTIAGCVSTGPVGCLLGKWVGEMAAAPLGTISNGISLGSTAISCIGSFAGDPKEGGGFTGSNIKNCAVSALITGVGIIPESNIDAIAASYALCRSEGRCPPQ